MASKIESKADKEIGGFSLFQPLGSSVSQRQANAIFALRLILEAIKPKLLFSPFGICVAVWFSQQLSEKSQ